MALPKKNFASIDLAKFVASLLVIELHLGPTLWFFQQSLCRLAVPFFFACAGYFLFGRLSDPRHDWPPVRRYLLRILRLYLIWTALYYIALLTLSPHFNPENIEFFQSPASVLHHLFLSGSWSVLWYLLALLWAVLLCWIGLRRGLGPTALLIVSGVFHAVGLLGQAYAPLIEAVPLLGSLPQGLALLGSSRSGLFFGFFYVALGYFLARRPLPSLRTATCGFVFSLLLLTGEIFGVRALSLRITGVQSNPDFYLFTAPATVFLLSILLNFQKDSSPLHLALRKMSTLLYCSHVMFWLILCFLGWLFGVTLTDSALFVGVLILALLFSAAVTFLSCRTKLRWLHWLF